jgi:uncharacterized membrane protein
MQKLKEAIAIFAENFLYFTLIILSIRFPINFFSEIINTLVFTQGDWVKFATEGRLNKLLSLIFDPIYIGGIIYCLWCIKGGKQFYYIKALSAGVYKWRELFLVNVVAGLIIFCGFWMLIIPGILFYIMYSFNAPIVILEHHHTISSVLRRSVRLTMGKRWEIFWGVFILSIPVLITSISFGITHFLFRNILVNIILSCIVDIMLAIYPIMFFLFYWQAKKDG